MDGGYGKCDFCFEARREAAADEDRGIPEEYQQISIQVNKRQGAKYCEASTKNSFRVCPSWVNSHHILPQQSAIGIDESP